MDLIQVKNHIQGLISEIGKCRREIEAKGEAKAKAISDYDREMAKNLSVLRHSETYILGDKTYKQPPVSIMDKIARGLCADECYQREIAESGYKACISNLEALKAQLNGYQSIYKHLDSV